MPKVHTMTDAERIQQKRTLIKSIVKELGNIPDEYLPAVYAMVQSFRENLPATEPKTHTQRTVAPRYQKPSQSSPTTASPEKNKKAGSNEDEKPFWQPIE